MSENSKFCNFWAISTCNTSKESIFLIEFNFTQKKYDLFEKNLKKSNFSDFFVKTDADHLSLFAYFSNLCQNFSKLSLSVLWRGFEFKSQQRRNYYLQRPRNSGRLLAPYLPPTLVRVKKGSCSVLSFKWWFLRIWMKRKWNRLWHKGHPLYSCPNAACRQLHGLLLYLAYRRAPLLLQASC